MCGEYQHVLGMGGNSGLEIGEEFKDKGSNYICGERSNRSSYLFEGKSP